MLVPVFLLLMTTANAQQTLEPMPSLVTASGAAEAKNVPDMATIRIGVETQARTAKEAQASTSVLANRLIESALKVVSDRKAYQTSDLSLFPEYRNVPNQAPTIIGYRARNVLTVRVDDVSQVGPLIDAVTSAGATNVDSIAFGLKDDKGARRVALRDAVRDAREKAEAMAEGLGLKLGDVYSVEEGGGPIVRPYEMANVAMSKMATPVMPGEVAVNASVVVRFRLIK